MAPKNSRVTVVGRNLFLGVIAILSAACTARVGRRDHPEWIVTF
jgi:hypothetical protein